MNQNLRTRIYVAGPISVGDIDAHVKKAIDVGNLLIEKGYAPFVPHLDIFADRAGLAGTHRYECSLEVDFSFISVCDALLRLPGYSKGADREVHWAKSIGVPVYYTVEELLACVEPRG